MRILYANLALFLFVSVFGQRVTIKKVELAGEKIVVFYDLDDSNSSNEYLLNLYSSADNFVNPLTRVTGDVGSGIKPGVNKRMEWNIRQELGGYKGKIALEVRGRVYIPFVKLDALGGNGFKRGTSYLITWKSGDPSGQINLSLIRGDQLIQNAGTIANNGNYNLLIPPSAKSGSGYKLRFVNARNPEEVINSSEFKIKSKVPLALKLLPVVAAGGVAAVLLGGGGGTPPDGGGNNNGGGTDIPLPNLPE